MSVLNASAWRKFVIGVAVNVVSPICLCVILMILFGRGGEDDSQPSANESAPAVIPSQPAIRLVSGSSRDVATAEQDVAASKQDLARAWSELRIGEQALVPLQVSASQAEATVKEIHQRLQRSRLAEESQEQLIEAQRRESLAVDEAVQYAGLAYSSREAEFQRAQSAVARVEQQADLSRQSFRQVETEHALALADLEQSRLLIEINVVEAKIEMQRKMDRWLAEQRVYRAEDRENRNQLREQLGGNASILMSRQSEYQKEALEAGRAQRAAERRVAAHGELARSKGEAEVARSKRLVSDLNAKMSELAETLSSDKQEIITAKNSLLVARTARDTAHKKHAVLVISQQGARARLLASEQRLSALVKARGEDEQELLAARQAYEAAQRQMLPLQQRIEQARKEVEDAQQVLEDARNQLRNVNERAGPEYVIGL